MCCNGLECDKDRCPLRHPGQERAVIEIQPVAAAVPSVDDPVATVDMLPPPKEKPPPRRKSTTAPPPKPSSLAKDPADLMKVSFCISLYHFVCVGGSDRSSPTRYMCISLHVCCCGLSSIHRPHTLTSISTPDELQPTAEISEIPAHLLKEIEAGNCVAFVGSGFSVPAGFPTWHDLILGVTNRATELYPEEFTDEARGQVLEFLASKSLYLSLFLLSIFFRILSTCYL